jgi:hypothetical protein
VACPVGRFPERSLQVPGSPLEAPERPCRAATTISGAADRSEIKSDDASHRFENSLSSARILQFPSVRIATSLEQSWQRSGERPAYFRAPLTDRFGVIPRSLAVSCPYCNSAFAALSIPARCSRSRWSARASTNLIIHGSKPAALAAAPRVPHPRGSLPSNSHSAVEPAMSAVIALRMDVGTGMFSQAWHSSSSALATNARAADRCASAMTGNGAAAGSLKGASG